MGATVQVCGGKARLIAAVISLLTLGAPAVHGADTPPRLLRTAPLVNPIELAGTDLQPEVSASLSVDARGRVTRVDILEVKPPTELDAVVRETATRNLLEWRFAPARKDGAPVEATVAWRVQFHPTASDTTSYQGTDLFATMVEDPRVRQAEISDLPKDERGEILNRYARLADKSIDRSKRKRFDTPRFIVVTDAGDDRTAETLASNLEATFNILHGIFDQHVAPEPQPLKLVAFLFSSRSAFEAVRAELGAPAFAAGFYASPGFFVFHTEMPTPEDLLSAMLHETVHAYSDAHLRRSGVLLPLWMEEGLAEYFGNSRIEKKQLLPGKTMRGGFVHTRYGGAYRTSSFRMSADNVRRAVRSGKAPSLSDLLQASHPVFYGQDAELYYSLSWILVHFLRHGETTWADTQFPELMLYMVEGYGADVALRTVYGIPDAELAQRFEKYVRTF